MIYSPALLSRTPIQSSPNETKPPQSIKPDEDPQWIKGITLVMVITGIALVVFLMLLDMSIVSTAIPKITSEFHALDDIAWYGSAYTISSACLQPLTGKFYALFSSKWTFLTFFAVFELGSLLCGIAISSKMLIIGRAVAGLGSSGLMNGGLIILAGAVPMQKRPFMLGIIMGVGQLGLVSGPVVGGALTTYATWRWCFYLNLPIGAAVGVLLLFTRIPSPKPSSNTTPPLQTLHQTLDLLGFALFAGASIQLLLALQYGGTTYPWSSATVIGLFIGSAATYTLFITWEHRMKNDAMIPGYLVKNRIISSSCVLSAGTFGMTMLLSYYLPVYFQSVRGRSALVSGVDLLPNILCQLVIAVLSGVLTSKTGYYLPWAVLGGMLNSVGNGLLSTLSPTTAVRDWAGFQALVGFGKGAVAQVVCLSPMIAIQNAVAPEEVATAMALMTCSQTFGGAIFLALGEVVFARALRGEIPRYAPDVNSDTVIAAGATGFREVVARKDLLGVLEAYAKSIDQVFYVGVGLCLVQFIAAWGVGWRDVRDKKNKEKEESV
ncbi:MFS general substrate transporter [Aspergillus ellipticus CBS 707.79]|uniref:MFS general substrate transporter n=1 Tax=Aspergillus ellipticus CBS 707.79 TaxID=1448320 RepID=A0A319DM23_9EURO|nr:MFS general substrate transporter [Aspergillus ellipticus CBS 707.79]